MATPVTSADTFVLLVPVAAVESGPAGNPWRPVLHTVDLETIASSAVWGNITGLIASQVDLSAALALKAPLASPTFTGTPAAPTATPANTNTTQLATTAFVQSAIGTPVGPIAGTTSGPLAPGAFAVVPEMTTSFTPVRTWAWADFEISVILVPGATGATIGVDFRFTVDGVADAASTRRESHQADSIVALTPGTVIRMVNMRRRLTGLTAGVPVTVAVEWMEVAGSNGTANGRLVERSLTVSDT